jgi:hypothetical protein
MGEEWEAVTPSGFIFGRFVRREDAEVKAWLESGVDREAEAAMRSVAGRLAEAEGEIKAQGYMLNTQYLEAEDDRAKCEDWEVIDEALVC